ncbi:hypothetical protein B0I35DRAFT_424854 [Stachybotrys elegans]|uniref:Uncharacterized protein n=1 Tax=Stachybotrys elegans TaxID=80388 RepID=A0A8K0WTY5_9HYPO|nr:hypothetical protein B0I35DRAFT_424854 [Stachybotrys elegans]
MVKQNENVDAEQVATFAEGKVADAVRRKPGAQKIEGQTPQLDTYTNDLERKKEDQAAAREEIKEQRKAGVNIDGFLGEGRLDNEGLGDV